MVDSFRSLIFVPGNNSRFLQKAESISADIVCLDLEDSVPDTQKIQARKLVRQVLGQRIKFNCGKLFIRTNSPDSSHILKDLNEIIHNGLDGIVIPKVSDTTQLKHIENTVANLEATNGLQRGQIKLAPSIESTKGVVNAYNIASFSSRVVALVFGIFDLLHDLQVTYTPDSIGAVYSRSKVPVDARAAGIPAIDGIWQNINDQIGLGKDCTIGRSLGYAGKCVIHPDQLDTVHRIYQPSMQDIELAKKICAIYKESIKQGRGATLIDGKMIDEVHYKQACDLLKYVTDKE